MVITLVLVAVVVIAAAFWVTYRAGARQGATNERVTSLEASRKAIATSVADVARAKDSVARQNDSLHTANVALHARNDSLAREVAASRAAALVVRARLVVQHDTAAVATDTGVVRIPIPAVLAQQLTAERASMDSSYRALERHQDSVVTENRRLLQENAGLRVEIALDSTATQRLRQLADSDAAEIDTLKKAHRPRLTFGEGVAAGSGGALALIAFIATVF